MYNPVLHSHRLIQLYWSHNDDSVLPLTLFNSVVPLTLFNSVVMVT